ncbi:MAG: exodeoxyribonuclease VII small subunit [Bdellovibrionaceae bacterium]|nr:exodeoxyribonuclease VII small subunit [Pseudobdellovibrionaceae bacterium]
MASSNKKTEQTVNSFESKIQRLDEIVKSMETGELPLEESLKLFEEGVKLSRECQGELEAAEQKVEVLLNAETMQTQKFESKD